MLFLIEFTLFYHTEDEVLHTNSEWAQLTTREHIINRVGEMLVCGLRDAKYFSRGVH